MADRGQSETVGVVLLTGVVVILVSVVGVVVLGGIGSDAGPLATFTVTANGTHIDVEHTGGDTFDTGDVGVLVDSDAETRRFTLDAANLTDEDGDGRFGFGDRVVREHGVAGESARVVVVHGPTDTVLDETTVTLRE